MPPKKAPKGGDSAPGGGEGRSGGPGGRGGDGVGKEWTGKKGREARVSLVHLEEGAVMDALERMARKVGTAGTVDRVARPASSRGCIVGAAPAVTAATSTLRPPVGASACASVSCHVV